MRASAKAYVAAVLCLGAAVLFVAFRDWHSEDPTRFAVYFILAVLAGTLKIRLPGMTGTYSMMFLFVLIGVASFTLAETMALACTSIAVQTYWHSAKPPRLIHAIFNVAAIASSVAAAFAIAGAVGELLWVRLGAAAAVYYIVNTLLVSGVLSLVDSKPLLPLWSQWFRWSLTYYIVGVIVAALMILADRYFGWELSLLLLPAMYLEYLYSRFRVSSYRGAAPRNFGRSAS